MTADGLNAKFLIDSSFAFAQLLELSGVKKLRS